MRVLIVSCVFPPEPVVSSQTSVQIAQALVERGHTVTVITAFPSRPAGRLYPGYRRCLFQRRHVDDGYDVLRCFSSLSPRSSLFGRFLENFSFGLTSAWATLTIARPDVIYANTWPIVATGLLAGVARLRHIPLVISVQDVYPESLLTQKRLKATGILARGMRRIDRWIARQCRAVVVISRRFETLYREDRGVSPERLHHIPNWIDGESVLVDAGLSAAFRIRKGVPESAFLFVYGGNIGAAAGVETFIEAFSHLRHCHQCYLLIAGEGSRLEDCRRMAATIENPRVLFHTPWPAAETSLVLGAADALVLPTRGQQANASVPSKLLAYFLSGRPVLALAAADTELAELVNAGGGWVVPPDQPGELAAAIENLLATDKSALTQRGEQGRISALSHLTRAAVLPRLVSVVEQEGKHLV